MEFGVSEIQLYSVHDMKRARTQYGYKKKAKPSRAKRAKAVSAGGQVLTVRKSNTPFTPELKAVDNWIDAIFTPGFTSTNHVMLLNGLLLGADRQNRIGRKIQTKKIHVRCVLHPQTPDENLVAEDLLIMLVLDVDSVTTGALANLSNLLQDTNYGGTQRTGVFSGQNLNGTSRFKILKKVMIPLRSCGTATGVVSCGGNVFQAASNLMEFEWHVDCDIITKYNSGNTGSVSDIENGAIYIMWQTSGENDTNFAAMSITTRIRYYD